MRGWAIAAVLGLVGCGGGKEADRPVQWYPDVGPLLVDRCAACHQEGGIGPFSMVDFEQVEPRAQAILDAIETGWMPPWAAQEVEDCTPDVPFRDDPRLSPDEIQLVRDWVDAGAPAGKPAPLPIPRTRDLEDPTTVVQLPQPFAVEGESDVYQCFRIEVPHDTDVWITRMQVLPDNDAVVHHVLVWNDPDDQSLGKVGPDGSYPCSGEPDIWPTDLIGGWVPGQPIVENPEGTGTLFKAGASIVVNVHYHPVDGRTELDQTRIALEWTTEKPAQYVTYYLVDLPFGAEVKSGDFKIPADKEEHVERLRFDPYQYLPLEIDLPIFAIMPHMHYRGTAMDVRLVHDTGADPTCLIAARDFRFDFQNNYYYDVDSIDQMPRMVPGDTMKITCTYNNSWSNPYMEEALEASGVDEPIDVYWGEETGDEMCMAVVGLVIPPVDLTDWF